MLKYTSGLGASVAGGRGSNPVTIDNRENVGHKILVFLPSDLLLILPNERMNCPL